MVNVVVNVSKIVLAAGVATGIIILATKADAEGAKEVLNTAAKGCCHNNRMDLVAPVNAPERDNYQTDTDEGGNEA